MEISEKGCFVGKTGNRIKVKLGRQVIKEVSISKVEGVIIGKGVALSSDFLVLCAQNNVSVFFSSTPSTYFLPSTSLSRPIVRISQMKLSSKKKKEFIYKIILHKILYQKEVAALFGINLDTHFSMDFSLPLDNFITEAMNKEALFAKSYWHGFSSLFRDFRRVKLFANDNLNRSLNYGYGILKYSVEKAILSVGLDPYIGILHSTKNYRESFVFDVMESFRPFIDFCVFSYLRSNMNKMDEEFGLFKRDLANQIMSFFKNRNFIFDDMIYTFQLGLMAQVRAFARFFMEGKPFRVMRVNKWSL